MNQSSIRTVPDIFERSIRRLPRSPAMTRWTPRAEHHVSSEELERDVIRLAAGLKRIGLTRGDRVLLVSENRPEWACIDYATLFAGGVLVPVYTSLTPAQLRYILENSGACIAIASSQELLDKLVEAARGLAGINLVAVIDRNAAAPDVMHLHSIMAMGDDHLVEDPEIWRRPAPVEDDLATIIYTSGTTGPPKGVMLTHRNLVSNVLALCETLDFNAGDTTLSFLPLCHVTQRLADYCYFHRGARIVYVGIEDLPAGLAAVRPTTFPGVPRVFEKFREAVLARIAAAPAPRRALFDWALRVGREMMARNREGLEPGLWLRLRHALADRLVFSKVKAAMGGRVRYAVCGGAPLNPGVMEFFLSMGFPILEGYGLTESTVLTINRPGRAVPGVVGPPLPGVELRFVGGNGDGGEIVARSPGVALGYYREEERTRRTFENGWLHTGDLGRLDTGGNLVITGRVKDILVTSGGKKVTPALIEQAVAASGFVSQVVLVGDNRKFISALIVPDRTHLLAFCSRQGLAGGSTPYEEILAHPEVRGLYERIISESTSDFARYERIKKFALLPHEFTIEGGELTPTMKVKRRIVEEKYGHLIESFYREG